MSYELDSIALVTTFAHYADNKRLPLELFDHPDYIALQATDIYDFSRKVKETEPRAEQITVTEAEDRFVATVKLLGAIGVANLDRLHWLEIIEPTQEEIELGVLGADSVGFYYPDFEKAQAVLGARGVPYTIDDFPAPTIRAGYSETGVSGEFRLSKVPLGALVIEDIEADRVTFVKRAA